MSLAIIDFDLSDMLDVDFDPRRTKVWVDTNIANDTIIDTADGVEKIRLGSGRVTLNADGTGEFATPIPAANFNPSSWQINVHVDYPDRNKRGGRGSRTFGPYTITTSKNLADLEEEQAIPPDYSGSAFIAQAQAILDQQESLAGIDDTDSAIAYAMEFGDDTPDYLAGTIATGVTANTLRPSLALMPTLAQADATRSAGFQRVAYEDTTIFTETWTALTNWTTSSMAVSGGLLAYSGSGANVRLARGVNLGTTTTMRARTSIVLPAPSGASNFLLVGVTAAGLATVTPGGAALTSSDAIVAAGFDTATNSLISFQGISAGGAGTATYIAGTTPPTGVIHATITVDENWLSIFFRSDSGAWEGGARWLRTDVGAINNLLIRNGDARAGSGGKVGTLQARPAFASLGPAVTEATPGSTVTIPQNTSRLRVLTPTGYDSRVANSLILYCHGYTGSGLSTAAPPLGGNADVAAFANNLASAGFIVASSDGGGTTEWGSTAGLQEHLAAYRYVRDHYAIRNVILVGVSMGGLSSLRLIADGLVPAVGWLGLSPVVSLRNQYDDNTEHAASIRAAWGIAGDGSDYASKTAGGDPNLLHATRFRGLPMKVRTNATDAVVNPAHHTDLLAAKVSSMAREWSKETVAGSGHLDADVYNTTTLLPFLRRCASS